MMSCFGISATAFCSSPAWLTRPRKAAVVKVMKLNTTTATIAMTTNDHLVQRLQQGFALVLTFQIMRKQTLFLATAS